MSERCERIDGYVPAEGRHGECRLGDCLRSFDDLLAFAGCCNYTSDLTDPDCSGTLARGATATCTIVNTLKGAGVLTIEKSCPGGAYAVGDTFQPKDGTANAGSAIACSASTTYTTTPGVAYAITEAAAGTTNLNNYTSDLTDPDCSGTLARGATATCTIVNTLRKFTVITLVCEGSQLYSSSVTFDGDVKSSLNHGDALPGTVTEANLCSLGGARYTGKKSGTYTGQVVISP